MPGTRGRPPPRSSLRNDSSLGASSSCAHAALADAPSLVTTRLRRSQHGPNVPESLGFPRNSQARFLEKSLRAPRASNFGNVRTLTASLGSPTTIRSSLMAYVTDARELAFGYIRPLRQTQGQTPRTSLLLERRLRRSHSLGADAGVVAPRSDPRCAICSSLIDLVHTKNALGHAPRHRTLRRISRAASGFVSFSSPTPVQGRFENNPYEPHSNRRSVRLGSVSLTSSLHCALRRTGLRLTPLVGKGVGLPPRFDHGDSPLRYGRHSGPVPRFARIARLRYDCVSALGRLAPRLVANPGIRPRRFRAH